MTARLVRILTRRDIEKQITDCLAAQRDCELHRDDEGVDRCCESLNELLGKWASIPLQRSDG